MMSINKLYISEMGSEWRGMYSSQKWLYWLYALVLTPHIGAIIGAIFGRFGFSFIQEYVNTILILIAFLGCFSLFLKRICVSDILFCVFLIVWHLITPLLYPEVEEYATENNIRFIFTCIFLYLVGRTFDKNTSFTLLVAISYIGLILEILFLYVFGLEIDDTGNERTRMMSRSYTFLPFVLILIWNAFERGGILNFIAPIIGVFVLFSMGTRGPILCLVFFIAVYLLLFKKFKRNKLVKSLIVVMAAIFYTFSIPILLFASQLSASFGLSTRVFDSIFEDQMINYQESSGRDLIQQNIIDFISNSNNWLNAEFYRDRIASGSGSYAHNLELELLCDFGYIGGGLIIILLFYLFYQAFRGVWKTPMTPLLLVFFCSSIMQLQFSNSFLLSGVFWLFLGMCFTMESYNKTKHNFNRQQ